MDWSDEPAIAIDDFEWAQFTRISGAQTLALKTLDELRMAFDAVEIPDHVFIGITGSVGRLEQTTHSDVDFGIYALRAYDGTLVDLEQLSSKCHMTLVEKDLKAPNASGVLGEPMYLQQASIDLIGRQGLEGDSNAALTHRMLLLCESTYVAGETAWREGLEHIREAYLEHHRKQGRPPRFLLNDVVRYWRTMCVDFQGKMIERKDSGWGTRNAKLRMSRKLLFASSVLPLFATIGAPTSELDARLQSWYGITPLERLTACALLLGQGELADELLGAYDQFLLMLDANRAELEALDPQARDSDDTWIAFQQVEATFQLGLEKLFFDSELYESVRRYGLL